MADFAALLLVTRVIANTLTYVPDLIKASTGNIGLGDTAVTFFLTPAKTGKSICGIGPAVLIATASNATLGGGKWDTGPSFARFTEPAWGSAGVVVPNIFSLPGGKNRASADQIQIETSFSYNLPHSSSSSQRQRQRRLESTERKPLAGAIGSRRGKDCSATASRARLKHRAILQRDPACRYAFPEMAGEPAADPSPTRGEYVARG